MTDPIAVGEKYLTAESGLWSRQSERLSSGAGVVDALQIPGYRDALVFDEFLDTYNAVCRAFRDRCAEGAEQTECIALALAGVVRTFHDADQDSLRAQRYHS